MLYVDFTKIAHYKDITACVIILAVCMYLFVGIRKSSHNKTFKIIGAFLSVHLVIFPLIYLILLNLNPLSFEFDKEIKSNEEQVAIQELRHSYRPDDIQTTLSALSQIFSEGSSVLDTEISCVSSGNLIRCGSYFLGMTYSKNVSYDRPAYGQSLSIWDNNGKHKAQFVELETFRFSDEKETVRDYLNEKYNFYKAKSVNYSEGYVDIKKKGKIWSYRQILLYSVNIFSTGNMVPKTRTANLLYAIHEAIFWLFLGFIALKVFKEQSFKT